MLSRLGQRFGAPINEVNKRTTVSLRRLLEYIALLLFVGVTALRPLIAESYDSAPTSISEALTGVGDTTPVRTLAFDLLILAASVIVFATRASDRSTAYRRTGLEWGGAMILVTAVISCFAAGNKRLAINGAIDWLCGLVAAIALAQLLRAPWQRRLLIAAMVGSACVQAAQCYEQHFASFAETWDHYLATKEEFWAKQGVDLDSSRVAMFEARMRSREASGFLPHSSITGSYLALVGMVALGAAMDRSRRVKEHGGPHWPVVIACFVVSLFVLGALLLTGSRGALLATAATVGVGAVVFVARRWMSTHRRRAWLIGCLTFAGGIAAVAGHGVYHGTLPGVSLAFRWQYWTASGQLIADHPWTGVGRENFGRHYLQYKSIESPEEVSNPHNLFVQAAADWGLLGLLGMLVLIVGASRIVAGVNGAVENGIPPPANTTYSRTTAASVAWLLAVMLFVFGIRVPLLGTDDPHYIYYTTAVGAIAFAIGFSPFWFTFRTPREAPNDGERWTFLAGALGLFAFLLHDLINFALFVPQTMTTFFAALGLVLATRAPQGPAPDRSRRTRWFPAAVCLSAMVAVVAVGFAPVFRANRLIREGERMSPNEFQATLDPGQSGATAVDPYIRAFQADPLDPTPLALRLRRMVAMADGTSHEENALRDASSLILAALGRDPFNIGLRRLGASLNLRRAQRTRQRSDFAIAIAMAKGARELYPQDPQGLILLGDVEAAAGEALNDSTHIDSAIKHYRRALELDDQRLWWEKLRRMSPKERWTVEQKIERLRDEG